MATEFMTSPLIMTTQNQSQETPDGFNEELDLHSNVSPRCEAFVMTGEKMLRLNSKISSSYLQARQDELPPLVTATEVAETPENQARKRGPFDDFPSMQPHRSGKRSKQSNFTSMGVPGSQSENTLDTPQCTSTEHANSHVEDYYEDGQASSVTVNAMCRRPNNNGASTSTVQTYSSPTSPLPPSEPGFKSEPVSPFRQAQTTTPRRHNHRESPLAARRGDSFKLTISVGMREGDTRSNAGDSGVVVHMHDNMDEKYDLHNNNNGTCITVDENPPDSPASISSSTPLKEKLRQLDQSCNGIMRGMTPLGDADKANAARLAHRLYNLDGFKMADVAPILAKNNDYYSLVAEEYVQSFSFHNQTLEYALRCFLAKFNLTGESDDRDRILQYFSRRYLQCNPTLFSTQDEVHVLVAALLLLNGDLHGPNLGKRMSCRDFVDNISHTGYSFKKDLLKKLYAAIRETPIQWARDDESSFGGSQMPFDRRGSKLSTLPDPETQVDYKKSWVMRKCVIDEDGKRTPFGRRGWKIFYATLKGMVLYLHTKENGFKSGTYNTFKNAIRLHHAFALPAPYYKKKHNVFRLRTATLGEYLFQASNPEDMQDWMNKINFIAACFSRPPLPAPVSSDADTFHRPLLPSAASTLSMTEQLQEHEHQLEMIDERRNLLVPPPLHATGRQRDEYFLKERYIGEEHDRYTTYMGLLREQLDCQVDQPTDVPSLRQSLDKKLNCISQPENGDNHDNISYKEAIFGGHASQSQSSNDMIMDVS